MEGMPFDRAAALRFGWETAKSKFFFFLGVMLLGAGVIILITVLGDRMPESILKIVLMLCSNVWGMLVAIGTAAIALKICDGKEASIGDFFVEPGVLWAYIVAAVLATAFIGMGILLLIVPGVIFYLKLLFYPYYILDNYGGVINSLQSSWNRTAGMKWELFKFSLYIVMVNLLGLLCLGVGLLVTIPMTWVATAHVYRQLVPKAQV